MEDNPYIDSTPMAEEDHLLYAEALDDLLEITRPWKWRERRLVEQARGHHLMKRAVLASERELWGTTSVL